MTQSSNSFFAIDRARHTPAERDGTVMFLRLPAIMHATGLSRSTLYRLIASEQFPRPVKLGPRAVAWRRSDLDAWSAARPVTTH